MYGLLNIGNFDFSESTESQSSEQLTEHIFKSDDSSIKDFPLSKLQRLEIIDAQYEIFELAKLNKAKVNIKIDCRKLIYFVEIESNYFSCQGDEACYKLQNILQSSHNVTMQITPQNKILIGISINLKVNTYPQKGSIGTYQMSSFEKIELSKYIIIELKLKNATYGSYPAYIDASIKIKGETKARNATLLIKTPLKIGNTKLMIPNGQQLDISDEDYQKLESKFWWMYFHKATSSFYKNPSSLSLMKTVSQNLKYLRWSKGLSFFEGARAIGVSLYTLYKLENGKFKSKDLKKINLELFKNTYSIEKHELYIARNFVKAEIYFLYSYIEFDALSFELNCRKKNPTEHLNF